ncbi:MAG: methyltransferase domain-containing protein, partial [Pyrinomonadaceae bacterium]
EKFRLMAGARVFMMPSDNESFSIVTLEAMAQGTPVLSSGGCEVLVDHLAQSSAGRIYRDYEGFAASLGEMLADEARRREMGAWAREYAVSKYPHERIRDSLVEAVESVAVQTTSAGSSIVPGAALPAEAPPLPLPEGWSEERVRELVASVQVEGAVPEELRNYALTDFKRFVYTLGLVPERPHMEVLELGANPYFMSVLLAKFRDARLHLANFFGGDEEKGHGAEGSQDVFVHQTGEQMTLRYKHFNLEQDPFPYADRSFDVVLFCEIIEHLLYDPVHALTEIRRVLRPGGQLILTTPNVARLDQACRLVAGENVHDPYSGFGPYGRHNREYTLAEISGLLAENHYRTELIFTADVHEMRDPTRAVLGLIRGALAERASDLGQYIFCRARVADGREQLPPVRPAWLYRSTHKPFPRVTLCPPR